MAFKLNKFNNGQCIKRVLVVLLILACHLAFSQTESMETLFGNKNDKIVVSKFIGPGLKCIVSNDKLITPMALFIGGKGGLILNKHLMLGLGLWGKVTPLRYRGDYCRINKQSGQQVIVTNQRLGVDYGYIGGNIAYIVAPYKSMHYSFGFMVGGGTSNEYAINSNGSQGTTFNSPGFWLIEPTVNLELNLTSYSRIEMGLGYQLLFANYFESLSTSDISGLTISMLLKFGTY